MCRLLIWCNQDMFIYFLLAFWELDSFPISIIWNCEVYPSLCMFFSRWISTYTETRYDVQNMYMNLIFSTLQHSTTDISNSINLFLYSRHLFWRWLCKPISVDGHLQSSDSIWLTGRMAKNLIALFGYTSARRWV